MITFEANMGDEVLQGEIYAPAGIGGDYYYIRIGNRHHGQVVKTSAGWRVYLNSNSELCLEDCEIILDLVREHGSSGAI